MPSPASKRPLTARPRAGARLLLGVIGGLFLLVLLGAVLALQRTIPGATTAARLDGAGLFSLTNVWRIHLTFAPSQWQAMEPKGGAGPFGGPRPPGGPGGFGPGSLVAPAFLKAGDTNHDGKLSEEEFSAAGQAWFTAWDTNTSGTVDAAKIGAGLSSLLGASGGLRQAGPGPGGPPPLSRANRYPHVRADLDFEGWLFRDVSVRYKGNNTYMTSRQSLKRPLKLELNRGFKGRRLGGVTTLNLHNNVNDPGCMNEPLSYRLFRDAGVPAARTAYARVYLTVPGQYTNQYVGLYSVVENLDNNFTRSRFGTKRGALFKPATRQVFEDLGDNWPAYERAYAPKSAIFDHEAKRVIEFSKLVSHATDEEFAARLEEFLDLDEFARFMAVTVWLSNMDSVLSMGQNFYVYLHPKTQQFQFLPWDFDHSFGQFPMAGSAEQLEHLSILRPWSGQVLFLERVFKVENFKRSYLARMKEFSGTIFNPQRLREQVDEVAPVLRPPVKEESAELLARFEQVVAGQKIVPGGFGGPPPGRGRAAEDQRMRPGRLGMEERPIEFPDRSRGARGRSFGGPGGGFGQPMNPIKGFVVARAQSVNDQLAGKAEGAVLMRSGPGGPPGRGGPGPEMFLAQAFMSALDADEDGLVSEAEFQRGFLKWFETWNTDHSGTLTEDQLRAGMSKTLSPFRGGPPPGFGPPDEMGPPAHPGGGSAAGPTPLSPE
jgi:spore coat protein H